jgi:alkylation response protein AidB-like acyl-CoA dehydrogenase
VSTVLTDDQEALQRLAADMFAKESPTEVIRRVAAEEPGYDLALWKRCADLGLLGLEVPDVLGGSGQGVRESSLVLAGIGSAAVPGPYLSQLLCVAALSSCPPSTTRDGWLSALGAGEIVGALILDTLGRDGRSEFRLRARSTPAGGLMLSGDAGVILDVPSASFLLAAAEDEDSPVLLGLEGDSLAASSVKPVPLVDMTRRAGRTRFDDVRLNTHAVLARGAEAHAVLERLRCLAAAWIAVDSVAGATATLERTVNYVSNRHQFGRPVGTFQAVKHRCADMFVWVETARVAADAAIDRLSAGDPRDAPDQSAIYWSSAAKAAATAAYAKVAGNAVQLHGGIGFTWDYDLHLWLKRAKLNESLFGDIESHRARIARWLWRTYAESPA